MAYKAGSFNDLRVSDRLLLNNQRIQQVGDPLVDTDAVNKRYVDEKMKASFSVGEGLMMNNATNTIELQTPISVGLGGTGSNVFLKDALLIGNDTNNLISAENLRWEQQKLKLSCPNLFCENIITTKHINTTELQGTRSSFEKITCFNLSAQEAQINKCHFTNVYCSGTSEFNQIMCHYKPVYCNNSTDYELSSSDMLSGVFIRNNQINNVTDSLPNTEDILNNLLNYNTGTKFDFYYVNKGGFDVVLKLGENTITNRTLVINPNEVMKLECMIIDNQIYLI
jgi:hypothetical protein